MKLSDIPFDLSLLPERRGVYIVGGTTRDLILGHPPVDYDIAVSQNPEIFAENTAARSRGRLVRMGRPGKRSFRVVAGNTILDITGLNGPTIRHDLEARDLTINAMAIELSSGTLLDWAGGRQDLAERQIRMVSEKSFQEDPIRLLRAVRLAATLGFSIEIRTQSAMARDAGLIRLSAGERIRSELHQLFSCRNSAPQIAMMAETGLLTSVFPELGEALTSSPHDPPDTDLLGHILNAYAALENLLSNLPPGFPSGGMGGAASPAHPDQAAWLKCALLLSHAGISQGLPRSPLAGFVNGQGATCGASVVEIICRRLRLSAKEKGLVTGIVRQHARLFQLYRQFTERTLTPTAATRFFMAAETLTPHLLLHALADASGAPSGRFQNTTAFADFTRHMLRAYYETYLTGRARPPLVTGRDLISSFGLSPSPLFKKVLTRIEEARLAGDLVDRTTALKMAEDMIHMFKS